MEEKKSNPSLGWLTLNRACNNRCEWCYAQGTGFKDVNLSLELAKKLIFFLKDIGVKRAILLGGEPTLYNHLPEVIKMLIEAGIQPVTVSNGRRFADKSYARMMTDTGFKGISFSIKAANKEQYIKLTGSDGYYEMIQGYHNLRELGVFVPFSVTVVSAHIETLPELLGNLIKEGVKRISIDMANPIVSNGIVKADGIADPKVLANVADIAHKVLSNSTVEYDIFSGIPLCILSKETKDELMREGRLVSCCHAMLGRGIIFDQDGCVIHCNELSEFPLAKYGVDFNDIESFEKFWNSKEKEEFNRTFLRYPAERCVDCPDWELCGGGCPLRWLHWNPKDFIMKTKRR